MFCLLFLFFVVLYVMCLHIVVENTTIIIKNVYSSHQNATLTYIIFRYAYSIIERRNKLISLSVKLALYRIKQ